MGVQKFGQSVGLKEQKEVEHYSHIAIVPFTTLDKIPTGRRIDELIKDKKMSRLQVSERIGINRSTFDSMVTGSRGREVYGYELKKINEVLKISYERFIQQDMVPIYRNFKQAMREQNYVEALPLAEEMNSLARGFSERCRTLNDLGRVHYYLKEYDKAHQYWLDAKVYAEKVLTHYGDAEKLYDILRNLLISYDRRKEYSHAEEIINKSKENFTSDPDRAGVICYYSATMAYNSGDMIKYREKMYEALVISPGRTTLAYTVKHNITSAISSINLGTMRSQRSILSRL